MTGKAFFGAFALSSTLVLAIAHAGCGDASPDRFIANFDAGPDGAVEASVEIDSGIDPTLGGPCSDDAQCDDQIPCTFDRCDTSLKRCRNTPDDTQCQDNLYCNGVERCVIRKGCTPGAVVTCQDDNGCTIDRCVEASKECEHKGRDSDGDGDADDHCVSGADCDDTDPTVNSKHAEVCGNFRDDNCNGQVDEQPCTVPAHDTCADALVIKAAGTYLLTTVATKPDYGTSCGTSTSGQDIVVAITVPAGGAKDVVVRGRTEPQSTTIGLALETKCGDSNTEIQCQHPPNLTEVRAIARSVAGGATIYVLVATAFESMVDLNVAFAAPTTKPTNETCATAKPVELEKPTDVSLIDATSDLSTCQDSGAIGGELTYSFVLTEKRDVRIFSSTTLGLGTPVVSLRDPADCTKILRCRGLSPSLFARGLAPGKYVFAVSGTSQLDASVLVRTYPASVPPPDQSCATAPALEPNKTTNIDLTNHEDAIKNHCPETSANAAYALSLPVASDVLLVGRFPLIEIGYVSLSLPVCDDYLTNGCAQGNTPQRVSLRNTPPGDYRVVVGDQLAQSASIIALVRPTVPPTAVGKADACTDAFTIPETGGFFTGDTSAMDLTGDFNSGCDVPNQPVGTAKDQLLRLVLTTNKRVIFDMSGSEMSTLLDLRSGEPCPGIEVPGGCSPANGGRRSFVDLTLNAGTYWVQIDGFAGSVGKWNLDVRVLPAEE